VNCWKFYGKDFFDQYEIITLFIFKMERSQWYNSVLNSEKMRRMLMALQQYESPENVASYANDEDTDADLNNDASEFQREIRKPMRLRWGRSTGKAPSEQKVG